MFQKTKKKKKTKSTRDKLSLLPAPTFDSETGEILKEENLEIHPERSEHSICILDAKP